MIHVDTLSLRDEFDVISAAREAGVRVPEPIAYLGDLDGREAFVMELVHGETIGRRIVKAPPPGLDVQMADELAKVHSIPLTRCPSAARPAISGSACTRELDQVDEPHPAIELGLVWCRERLPLERPEVVNHGDFRIGNLMVDENGLVAVLDWEFAHVSDPAEDLAWPLVRAWRFGRDDLRLGGIGAVEPYLERYAELTGVESRRTSCSRGRCSATASGRSARSTSPAATSGEERSVELAILGRLAAEMELELLDLIEKAA